MPGTRNMPSRFGRFEVSGKLGKGSFSTVYLAHDPHLERPVAIKVLHGDWEHDPKALRRFKTEATTLARLRSENIVFVYDFGYEDEQPFLVLEYVDGPSLQKVLYRLDGQALPPTLCAALMLQAANGLQAASRLGLVHRDIKPDNMLLASTGALKLADFGLVHLQGHGLTVAGDLLGSPSFMSPEQAEGAEVTPRSDLFSLGVVFYYCLAGVKPFKGAGVTEIQARIREAPHPPLASARPDLDPGLVEVVETLLAKDPAARRDVTWLRQSLEGYLARSGADPREAGERCLDLLAMYRAAPGTQDHAAKTEMASQPAPWPEAWEPAPRDSRSHGSRDRSDRPAPGAGRRGPAEGPSGDTAFGGENSFLRPRVSPWRWRLPWLAAGAAAFAFVLTVTVHFLSRPAPRPVAAARPARILLGPMPESLQVGAGFRPSASVDPASAPQDLVWSSADPERLDVRDGLAVGLAPGHAYLVAASASDPSRTARWPVEVWRAEAPPQPRPPAPREVPSSREKHDRDHIRDGKPEAARAKEPPPARKPAPAPAPHADPLALTVLSSPATLQALIIEDGRTLGQTPLYDKPGSAGRHIFAIAWPDGRHLDTALVLAPDATLRLPLGDRKLTFRAGPARP